MTRNNVDWQSTLRAYFWLTLGAVLLAVNVDLFLAPLNIAPGGVSGSALVINHVTHWPIGLTMLALNLPLAALGFKYLGRFQFLTKTLYVVLIYNLGADFLQPYLPHGLANELILNAICGGVMGGIATGLVYRGGGTSAGSGIISRVLQIRTGIPLSQMYLVTDGAIIFLEGLTFGWDKALYSLIMLFIWGLATDYVLEGPSVVRTVFIVTDNGPEVAHCLLSRLQVGVTAWTGEGMFTETERKVLFCTVNRPDVNAVRSIVNEIDPHAFIVIGQGHQASGGMLRNPKPRSA